MIIPDRVLWVDLETSGSEEDDPGAALLELGIVHSSGPPDFNIREEKNWVFSLNHYQLPFLSGWDDDVFKMHMNNGLMMQVLKDSQPIQACDVMTWLEDVGAFGKLTLDDVYRRRDNHQKVEIVWGGSGVMHFDRRWIKKFLSSEFDQSLTHWALDVGPVRRLVEMSRPDLLLEQDEKEHRALPDARRARDEWKYYFDLIKEHAI